MFAHVYLGKRFGLRSKSMILLEQLRTVNQSDLGKTVGYIDDQEVISKINSGLKKLLDLRKHLLRQPLRKVMLTATMIRVQPDWQAMIMSGSMT